MKRVQPTANDLGRGSPFCKPPAFRKVGISLGLALVLSLWLAAAPLVLAGGWATVTLDSLPVEPRAGETLHLGFTVRQHGIEPVNSFGADPLRPYLSAQNRDTGDSLRVNARQEGPQGHFVVDVVFPTPGTWTWSIVPEPFPAIPDQLAPLVVIPAVTEPVASTPAEAERASLSAWWLAGLAVVAVAGLALAWRWGARRRKWGVTIAGLTLTILILAGLLAPSLISGAAQPAESSTQYAETNSIPDAEYGRALFLAKGCPACHQHSRVSLSVPGPVIGPNLTIYQAEESFVRNWLRDPQAMRPNTRMPNLNLSEAEIDALVAFLSAGRETSSR